MNYANNQPTLNGTQNNAAANHSRIFMHNTHQKQFDRLKALHKTLYRTQHCPRVRRDTRSMQTSTI